MKTQGLAIKRIILIAGDIIIFYTALLAALIVRYGERWQGTVENHLGPFTIVLVIGLFVFYGMRLYDVVIGHGPTGWLESALVGLVLHFVGAVFFFYFVSRSWSQITPRGTLFLFFIIFSLLFIFWRKSARTSLLKYFRERALVVGEARIAKKLTRWLTEHGESGYDVYSTLTESLISTESLKELLESKNISTIIATKESMEKLAPDLVKLANFGINFWDMAAFYETRLEKIPLEFITDAWILQYVFRRETPINTISKSLFDLCAAGILLLLSLPFWPFIAVAVKISSPGPIFYSQQRVGQHGAVFTLKKFRTMYVDAEARGPQWASRNDPRITPIGRFLRMIHVDELPQLMNILAGDMSFVGPRPERPEFVKELSKTIPFYHARFFIKPGFTGWAQLNYSYGASAEDAAHKLEYDLYYLKHRSLLLDISIVLKTLRLFFSNPQR